MSRDKYLQVCALNISANPHPPEIYPRLFRKASRFIVKARGSDYAKISKIVENKDNFYLYTGRILLWTEIDIKGPWLDIDSDEEIAPDIKASINIPLSAKPNFRSFDFVFDNRNHVMYYESRNVLDASLGPTTARRIVAKMLSQDLLGFDSPEVSVTIVPEDGAVEKILSLPQLRTLTISVTRPNPDASSNDARRRVFEELERARAQKLEQTYTKSADAEHLVPTPDIRERAEVAASDGFVRGEGRDSNGRRLVVSTSEYPKRYYVNHEAGGSFLSRLLSAVRLL